MPFLKTCFRCLGAGLLAFGLPALSWAAALPENVAAQYHFIGASALAQSPDVSAAKAVFGLRSTVEFENMVMHHTAVLLAGTLRFKTNAASLILLRPLLEDCTRVESAASLGGNPGQPINAVFAFHLTGEHLQRWQNNLKAADETGGHAATFSGLAGWRWDNDAGAPLWMVAARDWLLIGRGENLAAVRSEYLSQIQKTGRPVPALALNCFEADVDWNKWTRWFSLDSCPLKLGRMQVGISAQAGGFKMVSHVTYPEAIDWQCPAPVYPTNLVHDPLASFVTGQDIEPFLKSDKAMSRLSSNPFRDQFYFWSMREMAFQSYAAWPAVDSASTLMSVAADALDVFNPALEKFNGTSLKFDEKGKSLAWVGLPLVSPTVYAVPPKRGPFLFAGLIPPTPGRGNPPAALWDQLRGQTNLVYYDWELTGPRVKYLLTVTEILPVLRMFDVGPAGPYKTVPEMAGQGKKPNGRRMVDPRIELEEAWLANLERYLGKTVTQVNKTGPAEVTIMRDSHFVFSSLELVLLSHWISDTPVGPVDWQLLPQAKMSGPGVPH